MFKLKIGPMVFLYVNLTENTNLETILCSCFNFGNTDGVYERTSAKFVTQAVLWYGEKYVQSFKTIG